MAVASPVIPGATWEITRRCHDRQFLLRPDVETRQAILYCVAYCCERYGMQLHALQIMTNHLHQSVTDPKGHRNDYVWALHSLIAKCIKRIRGTHGKEMAGPVWDASESYGRLWMASSEAFIESIVYILANPVTAGMVEHPNQWVGTTSTPEDMLGNFRRVVRRPNCLDDSYPQSVTLRVSLPPPFEGQGHAFVASVSERLAEVLREEKRKRDKEARKVVGTEAALNVDPFDSPRTLRNRSPIKPLFRAVKRKAIVQAKTTLIEWRRAYRLAFLAFREGKRTTVWPAGTWWFARYAGVVVAPASAWFTLGAS